MFYNVVTEVDPLTTGTVTMFWMNFLTICLYICSRRP
uniref:Uncharacterized protein n=1 Tax=Rhizophora mucronata TaxID=61149 RepID=A0A2P2PMI5_RHIMU